MLEQDNHMAHVHELWVPSLAPIFFTELLILLLSAGLLYYDHWVEALTAQVLYVALLAKFYVRRS